MSVTLRMYTMKSLTGRDFAVQLPDCMYKLQNIHGATRDGVVAGPVEISSSEVRKLDISDQNQEKAHGMAELETRQQQILQQLSLLKKQMDSIRNSLTINNTSRPEIISNSTTLEPLHLPDLVINANPQNPPYSLELIQRLWQDCVQFSVKTYIHSSVSSLNEKATELGKKLESFKPRKQGSSVNVRLIWKEIGADLELLISHTPITGEVNLLRFLARSSKHWNYEASPNPGETDDLLDIAYRISKSRTKTERSSLLQAIAKAVGKSQFLNGQSTIGVADVALYSAVKRTVTSTEINVGVGKWLQRCETC